MKRGEPRAFGRNAGTEKKIGDAGLHFLGGFVGEGDCEDGLSRNAAGDQTGHAESDGASLAGSSSSEKKNRALGSFRGETLFRIQRAKKVLHLFDRKKDYLTMLTDGERPRKFANICQEKLQTSFAGCERDFES